MKLPFNSVIVISAAAVGLSVGFAFRGHHRAPSIASLAAFSASIFPSTNSTLAGRRGGAPLADDSPLATQLEHNLALSTGVSRWLYWLDALEKAAPGDFPRLARLARGNPTALRLVATRWAQANPRHLFDSLVNSTKNGGSLPVNELADALFAEWTKRDPDAVIAALSEPGGAGLRQSWQHRVANTVMDNDVERGLSLLAQWSIGDYGPSMSGVAKWAAADPRHAADFTAAHALGYAAQLTMQTIGQEWARTDPVAALSFAAAHPGELGSALATASLQQWASQNIGDAANWLATADASTRTRLSSAFVEAWAKQDAAGALAWCGDNLTSSSQAQAVGGVLKGAAAKDVSAAAALVSGMDPSPARAEGAAAVAEKWFPRFASGNPVPPDAIPWLANLDPASQKRVVDQLQWSWSTSDPTSMAAFLAAAPDAQLPASAYSVLARQLARQNPTDALAWAANLPPDRGLPAGSDAFAEWRNSQPDAAENWLNDLPAGDPRRQPYFESAVRSIAWGSQATEQFAAMSAPDRANARGVIQAMNLPDYRRAQLLNVLAPR